MVMLSISELKKIKSSLFSLNTLSGVTSERCPSPRLCAEGPHIKVATVTSRWQRVGDLIGSRFELHTSRTRSVLPLVPSGQSKYIHLGIKYTNLKIPDQISS